MLIFEYRLRDNFFFSYGCVIAFMTLKRPFTSLLFYTSLCQKSSKPICVGLSESTTLEECAGCITCFLPQPAPAPDLSSLSIPGPTCSLPLLSAPPPSPQGHPVIFLHKLQMGCRPLLLTGIPEQEALKGQATCLKWEGRRELRKFKNKLLFQ